MTTLDYSAIPHRRARRIADVVPGETLVGWSCRLYTLMNLTWGYVETICDLCVQMRIRETRPLVATIRGLRAGYDRFRQKSLTAEEVAQETERGEEFEEIFGDDFSRLFYALDNETAKLGLTPGHRQLVIATQQALTLMDAVRIYARRCDAEMRERYGLNCPDECLVQTDFLRLYPLIPEFAGDQYRPDLEARRLTAGILVRRLESVRVRMNRDGEIVTI